MATDGHKRIHRWRKAQALHRKYGISILAAETALIGSVGKLPTGSILGGVLAQQKLKTTLENESTSETPMVLTRDVLLVRKGCGIFGNIVSRETCWMRKNIRTVPRSGRACGDTRLLHRAVAGCAGRYHRARTEHML